MVSLVGCADDETLNPSGSTCGVLNNVHSSAGASIAGNESIGGLSEYGFSAGASGEVTITPPTSSDCGAEIAQRLQGLCASCEVQGDAACEELTRRLFDLSQTPIEACAACGDAICSPGETGVEDDSGDTYCPLDCTACGDGTCGGKEALECPNNTNSATCHICQEDCSVCGDDACTGNENPTACPQDCEAECGDGDCKNGEQGNDPNAALYCPADCQGGSAKCGDGRCTPGVETPGSCAADCQACGDNICSAPTVCHVNGACANPPCTPETVCGAEDATTCAQDCAPQCQVDKERCNGNSREICNFLSRWEILACPDGSQCAVTAEDTNLTECVPQ